MTEQTRFYRQAITSKLSLHFELNGFIFLLVPEKYFGEFADYFCQAADKMEAAHEGSSQGSG